MNKMTLAELRKANLQRWMTDKNLNQTDVAARAGVGRAYLSNLFRPDRGFGEKTARNFEQVLFMPPLYLDAIKDAPQAVAMWDTPADLPEGVYALVPRIEVSLSAGNGKTAHEEANQLPPLAFREDWLRRKQVTRRENLRVCEVHGPSMEPYLTEGDVVLLDTGQTRLDEGSVYAVRYGDDVRIKRLFRRSDGSILVRSDNPRFPEEIVSPASVNDFAVIGKMIWRGG